MASSHMPRELDVVAMDVLCVLVVMVAPIDASPALLIVMLYPRVTCVKPKLRVREDAIEF